MCPLRVIQYIVVRLLEKIIQVVSNMVLSLRAFTHGKGAKDVHVFLAGSL